MIIFDIGCCHGHWIAANYTTIDNFIGVEANKASYHTAKERFADDTNIEILHYLVAAYDFEMIPFYVAQNSAGESSTASEWWVKNSRHIETEHWNNPIKVFSITLDNLISRYGEPGLIKIDVEGYEYEVLKGLTQKVPMLCFEYAEEQKDEIVKSINYLLQLGYTGFNIQHGDQFNYRPSEWMTRKHLFNSVNELETFRKQRWGMLWAK